MQANDQKVEPVQSPQPHATNDVVSDGKAAISISEQRWRSLENAFPFGAPTVVVCMLLWVAFQLLAYNDRTDWPTWLTGLPSLTVPHALAFSVATASIVALFLVRTRGLAALGFRSESIAGDLRWFVLAALGMAALYLSLAGLGYLGLMVFSDDAAGQFRRYLHQSFFKETSTLELLRVVVLYPILEEIWYRGLLYTPIRRNQGRVIAILATALIFALAHGNAFPINQFLGGLVFALAYEYRRGLIAPTLLHMAGNGALATVGWAYMRWMV